MNPIFGTRQSEGKPVRREGAMTRLLKSICGGRQTEISSSEGVDLGAFPDLLDEEKVATFCAACSEVFPGQQDICLPLGMADRLLKSQPPVKEELRLIKRLRQDCRGTLSIRLPRGQCSQSHSSIVLHFS